MVDKETYPAYDVGDAFDKSNYQQEAGGSHFSYAPLIVGLLWYLIGIVATKD